MNTLLAFAWPFSETVVERLGWVLVHSLWQFALVALLAGVTVRAMRRSSSSMRYGVLVVAMAVSIAVPMATWMLVPGDVPAPLASRVAFGSEQSSSDAIDPRADVPRLASDAMFASDGEVQSPASDPAVSETRPAVGPHTPAIVQPEPSWSVRAKTVLRPWLAWIVVGWSLGVVLCSARPLLGWHTLRRLNRVGVSPVSDEVLAAMRRVSEQLGLRRAVRVLQSTLARVPIVVGYFRPVILLPVSLVTSIPAAQLEAILAHELAHVRRHDFAVNLLQTLVETFFFYHPAVWWLSRQIRVEREYCCDDLVVRVFGNRVEYGRALIAIEQRRGQNSVLALGATDGSLLSRVRRIVGSNSECTASSMVERWPAALLGIVLIGTSTVLSMTWNLAAKDESKTERSIYVATLPNGVTVRLVGVGYHSSERREWWQANGSPLDKRPYDKLQGSVLKGDPRQADCREFAVQVQGLPKDHAVTTRFSRPVASSVIGQSNNGVYSVEMAAGPFPGDKTTSIFVGVCLEPLGPAQGIGADGSKLVAVDVPPDVKLFYDLIQPVRVESRDGQTELVLKPFDEIYLKADWRVVAIDNDGQETPSNSSGNNGQEATLGFKVPRERLARFEYRLRPYRHWVTFENVSLQPGQQTDVKVSTGPLPPLTFVATFPDGAIVELLAVDSESSHPDSQGWRPDGGALLNKVAWPTKTSQPTKYSHDLLVRFSGLPDGQQIGWRVNRLVLSANRSDTNPSTVRVSIDAAEKETELRIGLTETEWGPWQKVDAAAKLVDPVEVPRVCQDAYAKIQPDHIEPLTGHTRLNWRNAPPIDDRAMTEVVAIDKEGKKHSTYGSSLWGAANPQRSDDFKLPIELIDHFEYRHLPFRQWATFENVSLQPGQKTDAKVSVKSLPDKYAAMLPNGPMIELVGVCKNAAPAREGWTPDGRPIGEVEGWDRELRTTIEKRADSGTIIGTQGTPSSDARDLLFKIAGLKTQPAITLSSFPGARGGHHLPISEPYHNRISILLNQPSASHTFRLGITDEPWGTPQQISPTGELLNKLDESSPYWSSYQQIKLVRAGPFADDEQNTELTVEWPKNRAELFAFEIKAIDSDGKDVWVLNESEGSDKDGQSKARFILGDKLPRERLARFEYRLRPYRHWVTFENVSLQPEHKTEVKVKVESLSEATAEIREQPPVLKAVKPAFVLPDRWNVMAVGFDRDGKDLVTVSAEKAVAIRRWEVGEKTLTSEVKLESDLHANRFLMSQFMLSGDRRRVIGLIDNQVGIWETATGKLVKMLVLPKAMEHGGLRCLACTPDLSLIACGRMSGLGGFGPLHAHAIVWDVASGNVLQTVRHDDAVQLQCVALSHDGKWLATGGQRSGTCVWEVSTGKQLLGLPNVNSDRQHPDPKVSDDGVNQVLSLSFSPDGQQLAIGDMLGVKLVDGKSGKLLHRLDATFRFGRSGLVFSKDNQLLARIDTDKVVPIWSTQTGKLLTELPTEANGGAFSDDGRWFAVGYSDEKNATAVWKLRDGEKKVSDDERSQAVQEPGDDQAPTVGKEAATEKADTIAANGEIRGLLIDAATGKPVAGATVACGAIINDSLKGGGANTVTDAEGRYRLPVPSPGIYNVWLKKFDKDPAMTAAADDGILVEAGKVATSQLHLVKGRKVAGKVVDADGKPFANISVSCNSPAWPQSATTKDDGSFELTLPPGRAYCYVYESVAKTADNPFGFGRRADARLNVTATEETAPITLTLQTQESKFGDPKWLSRSTPGTQIVRHEHAADVTGTVVDVSGKPIPGAKVFREDGPINTSDDKGAFKVSIDKGTQFVMHAFAPGYHVWFGTPTSGDVLKIVLEPKEQPLVGPGAREPGQKTSQHEGVIDAVADKAIATTPPPKNREQIGEVLGKPVYRDEVKDDTLHGVFLNPVWTKYRDAHRVAITPTEDEIKFATEFFDKDHRKRLDAAGGEAKIREQMKALEERLARTDLPDEEQQKLELEHRVLRHKLKPPGRFFAEFMLNNWKFQKHLYDEFGGGRILFQQAGQEAFDATRTCLESLEKKGAFKITDAKLRAKLYEYWTRDHGFFLTDDKERIRKQFLEPEWVAPAAAKVPSKAKEPAKDATDVGASNAIREKAVAIDPNGEIAGCLVDAVTSKPVEGATIACGAVINDSLNAAINRA